MLNVRKSMIKNDSPRFLSCATVKEKKIPLTEMGNLKGEQVRGRK